MRCWNLSLEKVFELGIMSTNLLCVYSKWEWENRCSQYRNNMMNYLHSLCTCISVFISLWSFQLNFWPFLLQAWAKQIKSNWKCCSPGLAVRLWEKGKQRGEEDSEYYCYYILATISNSEFVTEFTSVAWIDDFLPLLSSFSWWSDGQVGRWQIMVCRLAK